MSVRLVNTIAGSALFFSSLYPIDSHAYSIGQATSVIPATTFVRGSTTQILGINDPLEQSDRVKTSANGSTQIRFIDDTILTIGPNSEVLLDNTVFDGNKAKSITIEMVRGSLRFVSGTSDRNAYHIKTQVATIGVRGTVIDLGYNDGKLLFNAVDGFGIVCKGTNCRQVKAGDAPISVTFGGFSTATLQEAAILWRNIDSAHFALAHKIGHNPAGAIGAATTLQQASQGGNSGNQGNNNGSNSGNSNSGNSNSNGNNNNSNNSSTSENNTGLSSDSPYSTPPLYNATVLTNDPILTPPTTGTGPAFPPSVTIFRANGTGADIPSDVLNNHGNDKQTYVFAARSSLAWDVNNTDLRAVTLGTQPDQLGGPQISVARTTAQVVDQKIGMDAGVPIYFMQSWGNGNVAFSDTNGVSGTVSLGLNQELQLMGWGYTGPLFDSPLKYGAIVNFTLENATTPVWSNGHTSPGTFTGNLAVAIGTTALHFGVSGLVTMSDGTYSFTTPTNGGQLVPLLSGASLPLSVDDGRARIFNVPVTTTGSNYGCSGTCMASIDFNIIYSKKVGITYQIENYLNFSDPTLSGIAVFGNPTSPSASATLAPTIVGFSDTSAGSVIGRASGQLDNSYNLASVNIAGYFRNKGSASTVESGSLGGVIGWERWAGGLVGTEGVSLNVNTDAGIHFVFGDPSINIPNGFSGGLSSGSQVQFSLAGATSPTLADGSVSPGSLGAGSKLGVDFTSQKVGVDLWVSIAGGLYHVTSNGGASNPSSSQINILSSGLFSQASLPVVVVTGSGAFVCTSSCAATVIGFFAGNDFNPGGQFGSYPIYAGLNYSLGDSSAVPVSGAAVFGRDFPVSNIGAFAFSQAGTSVAEVGNVTLNTVGSNTSPSGLALNYIQVGNGNQNFNRQPASVTDQGSIAGIIGWERWNNGTISYANNGSGGTQFTLGQDQGVHIIHGVAATNVPTSGNYLFTLAGATRPTVANGSVAAGTLSGTMGVNFGTMQASANLNVAINSENYGLNKSGMSITNNTFGASNIPVNNGALCTGTCTGQLGGFLAGPGATALGIMYQISGTTSPNTAISGVGAFKR